MCQVLLAPDAVVVPAIAKVYAAVFEHNPEGQNKFEGNVELWKTYH
jgi:hypothetical protein